jgi:hypothetical protein
MAGWHKEIKVEETFVATPVEGSVPETVPTPFDEASGSGTGRYPEGTNWTDVSDGTDYPPTGQLAVEAPKEPRKERFLEGKTIVSVETYARASVHVIDVLCTDNRHYFIKVSHNQAEVGGSADWGTGVIQHDGN